MLGLMVLCGAFIPFMKIDTDPENMLSNKEYVRLKHDELKKKFNMYDMLVIGIVNDEHEEGVFNKKSLTNIYDLSRFVYDLRSLDTITNEYVGVVQRDLMTPTNTDYIESLGSNRIKFEWLMNSPPQTEEEAISIKVRLLSNELFYNTIISEDGESMAMYVPITSKDESHRIAKKIQEKIDSFDGDDAYHITGLPVAEDTFGIEMFIQMAISAPAAMLLIFVLMMLFFRKLRLVLSPLIIAMVSVICTMGLLIGTGNTVHIMSSMIPIFIMPIAVLDSVHILSEFYDRYQSVGDKKSTLHIVMKELFRPMLFTSLTSAAGFISLAITPIPPVQVFGVFVGIGILLAWLLTITFIPAFIMLTSDESLSNFGQSPTDQEGGLLRRVLGMFQRLTLHRPWVVIGMLVLLTVVAGIGISKIEINDNPVKWFTEAHPIRVADKELNKHFGGTYMAFLNLEASDSASFSLDQVISKVNDDFGDLLNDEQQEEVGKALTTTIFEEGDDKHEMLSETILDIAYEYEDDDELFTLYENVADRISLMAIEDNQVFKRPEVLDYLLGMEAYLLKEGGVGKSTSLAKMVRYIHKELKGEKKGLGELPKDVSGVGQAILSYQNSHIPERLSHFVSSDYRSVNLWLQLRSGDNKDMEATIASVENFIEKNPPPIALSKDWFGLTYINVVWQKKMVQGMMNAFLGSFLVVFLMMSLLFRSIKWAALCMIPLTLTIVIIYGVIGWIGKDYDMPVAVLSSLALGLAVDFAIHFLVRSRSTLKETSSWSATSKLMFGEPSRAIVRNIIVIAVGFLPLLFANLIPYRTVGIILASILLISGAVTLLLLPAIIKVFRLKA